MAGVMMFVLFWRSACWRCQRKQPPWMPDLMTQSVRTRNRCSPMAGQIFRYDTFGVSHPPAASATVNIYTATIKKEKHI